MEDTDKRVKGDSENINIPTMILPPLDPLGGYTWQKETRGLEQENIWLISEVFMKKFLSKGLGECN